MKSSLPVSPFLNEKKLSELKCFPGLCKEVGKAPPFMKQAKFPTIKAHVAKFPRTGGSASEEEPTSASERHKYPALKHPTGTDCSFVGGNVW